MRRITPIPHDLLVPAITGVLLLAGWACRQHPEARLLPEAGLALYSIAYLVAGWAPAVAGVRAALRLRFDIDFLMVVAAVGAAAIGEYLDGGLLLFLFSLGHGLEHYAMGQARKAISALGKIAPRTALVRRPDGDVELMVEEVQVGDIVLVKPGERISVDGRIQSGQSAIDQSPITGESMPVEKTRGDEVFAGTLNGDGALEVRVIRLAADSTMSRMIRLVEEAQGQKSRVQHAADAFTRVYVPIVLGVVLFIAIFPPLLGWVGEHDGLSAAKVSLLRAITLLVGASPCALAISTPAAVLAGVAKAARSGVLIKGGMHLESLAVLRAIALDKTGTITRGRPEVTDVIVFEGFDENRALGFAAALESQSAHPLAKAIMVEAEARGVEVPAVRDLVAVRGRGLTGSVGGAPVRIGALRLFETPIPPRVRAEVERLENSARTVMLLSVGEVFAAAIALMDRPRGEAAAAFRRLEEMGVSPIVMLTGDNPSVANAVAAEVGIRSVRAGLLPADKIAAVAAIEREHHAVAMVGDGVNDAPALAAATVGIAMGGGGTDVALEAADIALMSSDLSKIPFAVALGRAARRIVRQNVAISMGMVGLLIPLAILGWLPVTLAVCLHEGSTVLVVLNGLRLLAFHDTPAAPAAEPHARREIEPQETVGSQR